MKTHNKFTLSFLITGMITVLSVIGSTAGSLAWYIYSRSVRVEFIGTSIAKSALLSVGIIDNAPYKIKQSTIEKYKLSREPYDGNSIVFTSSSDGLDYHVIQEYLTSSGYAVDMLFPLTTQDREISDDLTLYESPLHGETNIKRVDNIAKISHYVVLPLAFKMTDPSGGNKANVDVWMTSASVKASGEDIDKALRLFVENSQRKFLMNPSDKSTSAGSTKVGGLLDLNKDGLYDYDKTDENKEYYYGDMTDDSTITWANTEYGVPKESAQYDNVNDVSDETESTFYAKHAEEAHLANLTNVTPKVAKYETMGTVKPSYDGDNNYCEGDTGIRITTTNSTDKVGYVTFTIFIEGWDHAVVDKAANYSFTLSLAFETNRI